MPFSVVTAKRRHRAVPQALITLTVHSRSLRRSRRNSTAHYNIKNPTVHRLTKFLEIARTIYYITLRELLDYPSIESFTNYVKHYRFY